VKAVGGVSFRIEPGEMVAFLGPNGAGKTTTLKMLSGLIYPSGGSAKVLGYTPSDRADGFRRQFALVMGQKNQLWWDLPAADSFELHREIYSLPTAEFRKTIGLDVVAQVAIQTCLRDYHARRGVTMILTSHYMRDVEALCDRVLVITHGTLVHDGPLKDLTEKFGRSKLVKLQFAEAVPEGLERFGEVTRTEGPSVDLKVDRTRVGEILGAILDLSAVADVSVQDPPLEQTIARVFEEGRPTHDAA
jgi:ABC-2 type transport system ATP-binding protein